MKKQRQIFVKRRIKKCQQQQQKNWVNSFFLNTKKKKKKRQRGGVVVELGCYLYTRHSSCGPVSQTAQRDNRPSVSYTHLTLPTSVYV